MKRLEKKLARLKLLKNMCHKYSEESYYYAGRIEELEWVISRIKGGKVK